MKTARMLLAICGILAFVHPPGSALSQGAPSPATAKGTLEVGGTRITLSHAYAVPERDEEMLVILSDKPLNDKELKDVFERIRRVEADDLHTIEITLGANRTPTTVSVRHKSLMTRGGGFSTDNIYEPEKSDKQMIAGRFYRKSPGEFDGVSYSYDATVRAPIWKEPPPTYAGEAAKKSPQARAAIAFFKAGRAGDLQGLKKVVVSSSIPDLEGPMGKEILEMMKLGPDPTRMKISRVDVEGESASVTFQQIRKESTETTTIRLRMENGEWKVSPRP